MKFPRINVEKADALKKALTLESREATPEELESLWDNKSELALAFRDALSLETFYRLWGLKQSIG